MKNFLTLLSFLLFLSGCTRSYNFSVPDITPSKQKINVNLDSIAIDHGKYDPAKPITYIKLEDFTDEEIAEDFLLAWAIALRDALKKSELFDELAERKLKLFVGIQDFDTPPFGVHFTTYVSTNYQFIDKTSNNIIYSDAVNSEGFVPFDYSFFGYKRSNEAINRAVQNNISTFISHLQSQMTSN